MFCRISLKIKMEYLQNSRMSVLNVLSKIAIFYTHCALFTDFYSSFSCCSLNNQCFTNFSMFSLNFDRLYLLCPGVLERFPLRCTQCDCFPYSERSKTKHATEGVINKVFYIENNMRTSRRKFPYCGSHRL